MKKRILIFAVFLSIVLALVACTDANTDTSDNTITEVPETEEITEPEETIVVEEEITPEPIVIDENPMEKMLISSDEYSKLLHLWSIDSINVEEQGEVLMFTLKKSGSVLNLNYFFSDSRTEDTIKATYSDVIQGEWEKDEYSAGPMLDGVTDNGIDVLCQIINMSSYMDLSVFSSTKDEAKLNEFSTFFDSKWANGLVPLYSELDENKIRSTGIYVDNQSGLATYTKGYEYTGDVLSLIEFYKNELTSYDDYQIIFDYSDNEIVCCSNDGISVRIYYQEFFNEVVFEYSVPLESDQ